jgi:hypothetical protein
VRTGVSVRFLNLTSDGRREIIERERREIRDSWRLLSPHAAGREKQRLEQT